MKQGFYVKHNDKYIGSINTLKEARNEARKIGDNIEIYHGILKSDNKFEGKLIQKVKK